MTKCIIVDSGPLVAAFDPKDAYHTEAQDFFSTNKHRLITSDYVITEVSYFLGKFGSTDHRFAQQNRFLNLMADDQFITRLTVSNDDLKGALSIMKKYKDLPADLTDAILVNYCITNNSYDVISLDSDFSVYRGASKKKFTNHFQKYLIS